MSRLLLLCCWVLWCAALSRGYTGSDDRFVKKYAMMKVYESCFGPEVVREIRQEMRAASAKCQERGPLGALGPMGSMGAMGALDPAGPGLDRLDRPPLHRPGPGKQPQQQVDSARLQQALMAVLNRQAQGGGYSYRPVGGAPQGPQGPQGPQASAAAATVYPSASAPGYSPASGLADLLAQYQPAAPGGPAPAPAAAQGSGIYQAMPQVDPLQALQALQVLQQYQSRGNYHGHHGYQQQQQQQLQQQQQQQLQQLQQQQAAYYQPAFGRYSRNSRASKVASGSASSTDSAGSAAKVKASSRASRDLDVQGQQETLTTRTAAKAKASSRASRDLDVQGQQETLTTRTATKAKASSRASRDLDVQGQLETLTTRMTGRVKNVTCVMQELGYLNSALEPDFERIGSRIARLPVAAELRRDMLDGVQFCRQFSQCIPDSRRDKFMLSGELLRPMFFFRCYKHKKLEACIMKDVRERYQQAAGGSLDDNLLPNTRAMDLDREAGAAGAAGAEDRGAELDDDHMAAAVYEFLFGGDNLDSDPFF